MPNQYRKGTVAITLRMPESMKNELRREADAESTSVNRFIWRAVDQSLAAKRLRERVLNPLRGSARRRPRDPDALLALAFITRRRVLQQKTVRRTGPRTWELL
jgi:hypothetical protein